MIFDKLKELIMQHMDNDELSITMDTSFEELGIDSLDTVEMLMELEEDLGTELELEEKVSTVGELVAFIEKKLNK